MNLKTDFAFKFAFVNEHDKEMLISLINAILKGKDTIVDIQYLIPEQLGKTEEERRAIFDIHCKNKKDERFIIEMQIEGQPYFMDRCLYYATFPVQKQAKKGKWDYKLEPLYIITLLDFEIWKDDKECVNYHSLTNEKTHRVINKNLRIITVELPKFTKREEELKTVLDYWLFCFSHLHELKERPKEIKGKVFDKLFELTEINKLKSEDMEVYEKSLEQYDDVRLMMKYSRNNGRKEGRKEGREEVIRSMTKKMQESEMSIDLIAQLTGLTPKQIQQMK
jgi:predicted transposase/invertase (TIGR01784 family)